MQPGLAELVEGLLERLARAHRHGIILGANRHDVGSARCGKSKPGVDCFLRTGLGPVRLHRAQLNILGFRLQQASMPEAGCLTPTGALNRRSEEHTSEYGGEVT